MKRKRSSHDVIIINNPNTDKFIKHGGTPLKVHMSLEYHTGCKGTLELKNAVWKDKNLSVWERTEDIIGEIPPQDVHMFAIEFHLYCQQCKNAYFTLPYASKILAMDYVNDCLKLESNPFGKIHYEREFLELTLCARDIPTEILNIMINSVWMKELANLINQIEFIDSEFSTRMTINGLQLPPCPYIPGMHNILGGVNQGPYRPKERKVFSQSFQMGNEIFISGIRINGNLVKRNATFKKDITELDKDASYRVIPRMTSMHRMIDGLYVGNILIIKCDPDDNVTLDHVYIPNGSVKGSGKLVQFFG